MVGIPQLQIPEYNPAAPSAFDFAPLAQLMQQRAQQARAPADMSLAALGPDGAPAAPGAQAAVPYTVAGRSGYGCT